MRYNLLILLFSGSILFSQTFSPTSTSELQTAVDLWVSDETSAIATYGEINTWDVSLITDMSFLFDDSQIGSVNLSNWDVSNVLDMSYMFRNAQYFNGNISDWDVSNVINMLYMFDMALTQNSVFNGDLSDWDVSNVTNMVGMF